MRTVFELPREAWDDHIHGDGPHIGLTRPGFDKPDLDVAYRTLVGTGHKVDDAGVENTIARGRYGELAIDRDPTKKAEKRLKRLGFTGLNELIV